LLALDAVALSDCAYPAHKLMRRGQMKQVRP
jgi:hypothetical protein